MALVLSVKRTAVTSDCLTATITDSTGNYNITTNPTGYGSPNEVRSNLYLSLFVTAKKSTGDEPLTVPAFNPNTVTSWTITLGSDAWYEYYAFACLAWSNVVTYALNYITYDVSTAKYYKSLQAGNINHVVTDASWWVATVLPADFQAAVALVQPNIYSSTDDKCESCNSRTFEAKRLVAAECCDCNSDGCELQEYEKIRMKIEAVAIHEALGSFSKGEVILENLNDIMSEQAATNCGCN